MTDPTVPAQASSKPLIGGEKEGRPASNDEARRQPIGVYRFEPEAIRSGHALNYVSGEDILLHIKVRRSLDVNTEGLTVIVNDRREGAWGAEMRMAVPNASTFLEVRIFETGEGITIEVPEVASLTFPRIRSLREICEVETTSEIENLFVERRQSFSKSESLGSPMRITKTGSELTIRGALDQVTEKTITGWAFDAARPTMPVSLDLFVDGVLAARFPSDLYRADLKGMDGSDGHCAFVLPTPALLRDGQSHEVKLDPTNLTSTLTNSPRRVTLAPLILDKSPGRQDEEQISPFHNSPQPILAFAALMGVETNIVLAKVFEDIDYSGVDFSGKVILKNYRTLHDNFTGGSVRFTDLWFAADSILRCRLEILALDSLEIRPAQIRFLQPDLPSRSVFTIKQENLATEGITFVDLPLTNPYAPVIAVACTADGKLLGSTLLPFPSFCRGGPHAGEAIYMGRRSSPMSNIRALSDSLMREALGWGGTLGDRAIGRVEVDLRNATGTERIFSEPLKLWLATILHLRLAAAFDGSKPSDVQSAVEELVRLPRLDPDLEGRIASREANGRGSLQLPPDAIPTLSVLISRRLKISSGPGAVGPYIVADAVTGTPSWGVCFPAIDVDLLELQPRSAGTTFPRLFPAKSMHVPVVAAGPEVFDAPLAIRFLNPPRDQDSEALRVIAPDTNQSILRRTMTRLEREASLISVIVSEDLSLEDLENLLESVSIQTISLQVDVVATVRIGMHARLSKMQSILNRLFPGRSRIAETHSSSPSDLLNLASSHAKGKFFLIANEPIVLHDRRSLEVLATLMLGARVASASCVLVQERSSIQNGGKVKFFAGGVFPNGISLLNSPRLQLSEPATRVMLPQATYPVLANSFRFVLIRASIWSELEGLDTEHFPAENADIDFAVRALKLGYRHLCTSAVTASAITSGTSREDLDGLSANFLTTSEWEKVANSITILRVLR